MDNTFLNSKFLNPDYLFKQEVKVAKVVKNLDYPLLFNYFNGILFILAVFFILVITYVMVRMHELRKKEHAHLHHEIEEYAHNHKHQAEHVAESGIKNAKWLKVLEYLVSENAGDWKLAVIEADTMLDNLMTDLKFKGESLGEKLKNADRDKFHSLSTAWEVHTIRNRIAHEGSAFDLSLRETKRVIALYEQIFHEFGYV